MEKPLTDEEYAEQFIAEALVSYWFRRAEQYRRVAHVRRIVSPGEFGAEIELRDGRRYRTTVERVRKPMRHWV